MKFRLKVTAADWFCLGAVAGYAVLRQCEYWLSSRRMTREVNRIIPGAIRD